jgi:zinc D-Ala-D-Ala carboxypeptidase
MKRISKHIPYKEAVGSNYAKQKGISNKPNEEQVENMKLLAEEVFEPLRDWVDAPIKVNSMFRSLELNTALKGSKTSSHMKGEAMDITSMGGKSNLEMFHWIKDNLCFDQLIWEFGKEPKWLHVSFNKDNNRKQVLVTKKRGVYYTY